MIKRILINEIKLTRGLDPDENLKELAHDLKANGQRVPIVVLADYTLVDGLRRLMALNTIGVKEIDAVVCSTFEEAIEGLTLNHSGQFPDRIRRIWEIEQQINPLVHERRTRLTRERQFGVRRKDRVPSQAPQSRTLYEQAFGKNHDKVISTYRMAYLHKPSGWQGVLRELENRSIPVGTAYRRIRGKHPLNGNIRTLKEQLQLVNGGARQLTSVILALEKLAWPIVIPAEDRQSALGELKRNRAKLARFIHLLEEAEGE